ncbi:MAG: hypothetical protein ACI4JX_03540, partial [Oscillospiraceae bacterium]
YASAFNYSENVTYNGQTVSVYYCHFNGSSKVYTTSNAVGSENSSEAGITSGGVSKWGTRVKNGDSVSPKLTLKDYNARFMAFAYIQ